MTKKQLKTVAKQLLGASKTLAKISKPNSSGFKAVLQWLYDREDILEEEYKVKRKDIYSLTFEINSSNKPKTSLKLTD